jgi:hypothetical protein
MAQALGVVPCEREDLARIGLPDDAQVQLDSHGIASCGSRNRGIVADADFSNGRSHGFIGFTKCRRTLTAGGLPWRQRCCFVTTFSKRCSWLGAILLYSPT